MKFSWPIVGYMALVLASGAVLGVVGDRLYSVAVPVKVQATKRSQPPSPEEFRKKRFDDFKTKLKLNDDQATKIGFVYDETRALYEEEQKRSGPVYQSIDKNQTDKIRAILNTDQRDTYEQMLQRQRDRMKGKGGGRVGPGF